MTDYVMPLDAIVGQDELKLALALTAISPRIGGVLIQGERGNAKSTTVRSFAQILPQIALRKDCPYHCDPIHPFSFCPVCEHGTSETVMGQAPFIELPLGATEDRVLGHLDLEEVLRRSHTRFVPGLLAQAHRGILYIDEVNLLDDQLIDLLLDAASSGMAHIERDGFSLAYPAQFVLVGTMNPEEGEIRPQLLDRFGLSVEITTPQNIEERVLITERRLAFDQQPELFIEQWETSIQNWRQRLLNARQLLPEISMPTAILRYIAERAVQAHVEGLRADIVMAEASRAYAALNGKTWVDTMDVDVVAPLVLGHRTRPSSPPPPRGHQNSGSQDRSRQEGLHSPASSMPSEPHSSGGSAHHQDIDNPGDGGEAERIIPMNLFHHFMVSKDFGPWRYSLGMKKETGTRLLISRRLGQPSLSYLRGKNRKQFAHEPHAVFIDWPGTITAKIKRQHGTAHTQAWCRKDLIFRKSKHPRPVAVVFVVDTSASMGSIKRLGRVKGTIMKIAQKAYRKRAYFALLTFGHHQARVVLAPTNKLGRLRSILERMPARGNTPLWEGLQETALQLKKWNAKTPWVFQLYLMTDGKVPGITSHWDEHVLRARECKEALDQSPVHIQVIDADTSRIAMHWAKKIAQILHADYGTLEEGA
ncbi:ATP-binding protein [Sulfobacillus thermosulfidooxidans]|uniref:ATP-binding protein n=1 Tax=Sulfobacillus thermosulfidooxidans TaxID=28034 RepID=UPI0006B4CDE9|nr:ATP-binding protein [Sulfobacillus thermosulfidooxidans]